MKIGYLGPVGSYSSLVCDKVYSKEEKLPYNTISLALKDLKEGKLDCAVVPIENSINGGVGETLDKLYEYGLIISKAIIYPIDHSIAALDASSKIEIIYSHSQALAQCSEYIMKNYPNAKIIAMNSTAESFKKISDESISNAAAIGPESAAKKYNLKILERSIQDYKNNRTRFVIVEKKYSTNKKSSLTSIVVNPNKNVPRTLADILSVLKEVGINLAKIESRPSKSKIGNYLFYMDLDGKYEDENIQSALSKISLENEINFLGCYEVIEK